MNKHCKEFVKTVLLLRHAVLYTTCEKRGVKIINDFIWITQ